MKTLLRHSCLRFLLLPYLLVCSRAFAQEENFVTIVVDATAKRAPLKPVWGYFGYDEANYTTTPEGKELLKTLGSMQSAKVHTRTHFLFNSGDGTPSLKWGSTNLYSENAAGQPIYDFTIIDQIVTTTIEAGALPLFELGFMPKALSMHPEPYENSGTFVLDSGAFYPPADYKEWAGLVTTWAEHARERFEAGDSQTNWLWELWNEPDIGYFKGTVEDYGTLYDHTEAALHSVLPNAPLGGPAVASPEAEFLQEFLDHCAEGTNAVTGQTGTRLDLVTFHAKGGVTLVDDHVQMDLGRQMRLHRTGFETVARTPFADTPIIISEADPDGCAACSSTIHRYLDYRNSPAYGAYEVATMKRSLDLADEMGVDLQGVLTWAFTFPGTPYFAGYRALATNGIHLPVLNAFKLLGRLSGERVPVMSDGARSLNQLLESGVRDAPEIDALAAFDGDALRIVVWNYHDDLVPAAPASVALRVQVPRELGGKLVVSHERVDDTHGNAFSAWQSLGSPASPSSSELQQLREAMSLLEFESPRSLEVKDGLVSVSFELPRFGVSLLTLRPSDSSEADSNAGDCSCRQSSRPPRGSSLYLLAFVAMAMAASSRRKLLH